MVINVILWWDIIYCDIGGYVCNMIYGNEKQYISDILYMIR